MLSDVHSGDRLAVGYTWLADGTKLGVCDGNGVDGLEYVGSLIYGKSSVGLQLSEALFKDGVIRVGENGSQELNYFLKDHLGSVRVIVDGSGSVTERNDYYPFGARHLRSDYAQSGNRWKYNGKEIQPTGNGGYLDYGVRMYDAGIGRWLSVDPRAEDYLSQSPWHFSGNNPLLFVDAAGEDYWSTNDPDLIASFMYSLWSGFDTFNFYGWEHSSDAEFTGNLTYNDITGKYYTSYGTVRGGMATRIGLSFDAIIRPVVETYPYAGAFVREELSGFWQYLGYYTGIGGLDTYDFNGELSSPIPDDWSGLLSPWKVSGEGRLVSIAPLMQIGDPPLPGFKGGGIIGKWASRGLPHGDGGRTLTKSEKLIKALEEKLKIVTKRKDKVEIQHKIQRINRNAQKKAKGETHWRR